jgi:serine/threonine-protein kinase RsbW
MDDVELRLPPDVRYVGLARLILTSSARQAGMADERIEDLRIAVSEATANAMAAHAAADDDRPVVLTFGTTPGGQFGVSIAGVVPGDADGAPPPEVGDWSPEGGLGFTLIRGLADDVDIHEEPSMVVHMRFSVDDSVA